MQFFFIIVALLSFLTLSSQKYTTSLTNGIIGQFSHLYTHKCLIGNSNPPIGDCLLTNKNNLFQLYYYDSTVPYFYVVTYPQDNSAKYIMYYQYSSSPPYWTDASSYCLTTPCSYYSWPGDNFKFYANFSRGNTNNPLGTFTLKNSYSGFCLSFDIQNSQLVFAFKTCDPSDLTQVFGFLNPDTYLMNQVTSTADANNNGVTVTWSNPNNIANVAYMIIPGNQSISDQGTINLQNVKCTTQNGLSPVSFTNPGNYKTSVAITVNAMQSCNIYPTSNDTVTTYNLKAIHVYLDNSIGFSRSIQVFYKNQLSLEQMYLVGQTTQSTDQTQIFESSINSIEITNQLTMGFNNNIGQTYLTNTYQNLSINLNTSSKYSLTLVGNSMTLISVNGTNNQVLTQLLPCLSQTSATNSMNLTFDFSGVTSNYYKFKIVIKLTALNRMLQDSSSSATNTVAEIDSQQIYFIGSYTEIEDLIRKQNSAQNSNSEQSNNSAIVALAVVLSLVIFFLMVGILFWKRKKISEMFAKKERKYNDPAAPEIINSAPEIMNSAGPGNPQINQEDFIKNDGIRGSEIQQNLNQGNIEKEIMFEIKSEKVENRQELEIEHKENNECVNVLVFDEDE